jgi:hypothetical protein
VSRLKENPRAALVAGIGGFVLALAAGWFLVVSPKRDEAASLQQAVASKQVELAAKQAALARPAAKVKIKASDLYRLTKAMPDGTNMSGVLLDVHRLAGRNKLVFHSVTPASPTFGTAGLTVPMTVVVQGRFSSVSRFLGDVRSLVKVRDGRLDARGRTYSVTQVELGAPDDQTFPIVKATITLNAHSFVAPAPAVAPSTTTPSSEGTVAAGETP